MPHLYSWLLQSFQKSNSTKPPHERAHFLPPPSCIYFLPMQDVLKHTLQLNLFVGADLNVHSMKTYMCVSVYVYVCETGKYSKSSNKESEGITTKQINSTCLCVYLYLSYLYFAGYGLKTNPVFNFLPYPSMHRLHHSPMSTNPQSHSLSS